MHINVCVCTYRRPQLLLRLLSSLSNQDEQGHFSYSIIIADNDFRESARNAVLNYAVRTTVKIEYYVEPIKSISMARNMAVRHASGDMIAFIDDDELAPSNWLSLLFKAINKYKVSGVFGPVRPHFDTSPPPWIIRGRFFERPEHPTGYIMPWQECRTGNVLIRSKIIKGMSLLFDPKFGENAEDIDFFRRLIDAGHRFIWCNEAYVDEVVSPNRWRRCYMVNRALLRGKTALLHPKNRMASILRSIIAIPTYILALPVLQFLGHHYFMEYLVKLFDHLGKILALFRINPVRERKM